MSSDTERNTAVNDVDARHHLWELIKDIRFAMFTARHGNGHLHSRPMTTQNRDLDADSSVWFLMYRSGSPVADLQLDSAVSVVYADVSADSYVSVSGNAVVVEDMAKKEALWSKMAEAWFPGGANDPDLALVKVEITHADYWDVKESKFVQLYRMAKAAITGQPPTDLGEHATIHMR